MLLSLIILIFTIEKVFFIECMPLLINFRFLKLIYVFSVTLEMMGVSDGRLFCFAVERRIK